MTQHRILILGASYGSLLAAKLLLAGHDATLVCLPEEVALINQEGFRVRMPVKGRDGLIEVDSRKLRGRLNAAGPGAVNPAEYDLVVLAMQEPQYRGVRDLMKAIAASGKPCMSIMNMPPLPYVARLPGVDVAACRPCYVDPTVWDPFDPKQMTLCSPDPQAFRPPTEKVNVLQVRLPTNFKAARFASEAHTAILTRLQDELSALSDNSIHPTEAGATHENLVGHQDHALAVARIIRQVLGAAQTGRSLAETAGATQAP